MSVDSGYRYIVRTRYLTIFVAHQRKSARVSWLDRVRLEGAMARVLLVGELAQVPRYFSPSAGGLNEKQNKGCFLQGNGEFVGGRTELTELPGTGVEVLPNLPKC